MNNFIDVLKDKNLDSCYRSLEAIYNDQLGIQIQLNDEEDPYLLSNPKQLSSQTYQSVMKLDASDMEKILKEAFHKRLQQLSTSQLLNLQDHLKALSTPELQDTQYKDGKLKSTVVKQYIRVLKSSLADHLASHLIAEKQSSEVKRAIAHLERLLQEKTSAQRYKEIQSFYKKALGIGIKEVSMGDEMGSAPHVIDHYDKINTLAIQVDRTTKTTMLSTVDLESILDQYYKPIIATMTLSELFHYTKKTKEIIERLPVIPEHADYQVLRYLSPVFQSIKQQLLDTVEPMLAGNEPIHISNLALIITNMDQLPDTDQSIEPYLNQLINCTIDTDANKIKACDLSDYITARNFIAEQNNSNLDHVITALDKAIQDRLLILLQDYKQDVNKHRTDYNKSKKLASIDKMLGQVQTEGLTTKQILTNVQTIFSQDLAIHQRESLGRYIYQCICAFFKIKIEVTNYQGKLFDTLKPSQQSSAKRALSKNKPELEHGNESDDSNDETPLLKRTKRSDSV